tara:strand:- start:226869 stop:228716 length:1848 start_codon:yes stop_codon:yes gene_type:complete
LGSSSLSGTLPDNVLAAQARLLHRQVPQSLIGGTGVALCFLVLAFNRLPEATLILWTVIYLLVTLIRLYAYLQIKPSLDDSARVARWAASAPAILFLPGLVWGLMSAGMILSADGINFWIVVALLAGLSSGAVGALAVMHRCYLAYSVAMLFPFVLALFWIDQWLIASMVTLFFFMNNGFARNIYNANLDNILTKFENESLISQLEEQQSELQQQNQLIQAAMDEADEANRSKSVFLASASHDLAQPLHSLKLFLAALGQEMTSDSQQSLIHKATLCADNMSELFISLLDISKLDAGIVEVENRQHDVAHILEQLTMEFEPQVRSKGLTLKTSISSCIVLADPTVVQRVLRNLLHNALKYTSVGSITLAVESDAAQCARISITDTGPGMKAEELSHIFDEFYQVGNPERDRNRGLGLGLAIVKRLSDLTGMAVAVQSSPGNGSCFSITLPTVSIDEQALNEDNTKQVEHATDAAAFGAANILFIDDEEHTRQAMMIMLEHLGYQVIVADSLTQALDALTRVDLIPDLIISDYRLRDKKTGVQAILCLREEFNEEIPALIITGDTGAESLQDISEQGMSVLHKLSPHAVITEKITGLLGRHRTVRRHMLSSQNNLV